MSYFFLVLRLGLRSPLINGQGWPKTKDRTRSDQNIAKLEIHRFFRISGLVAKICLQQIVGLKRSESASQMHSVRFYRTTGAEEVAMEKLLIRHLNDQVAASPTLGEKTFVCQGSI